MVIFSYLRLIFHIIWYHTPCDEKVKKIEISYNFLN